MADILVHVPLRTAAPIMKSIIILIKLGADCLTEVISNHHAIAIVWTSYRIIIGARVCVRAAVLHGVAQ